MVKVNDTFQEPYADTIVTFTVMGKRPGSEDVWNCEVLGDMDWAGMKRVFTTDQINKKMEAARAWKRTGDDSHDWWESRKIGEIVHYNNGFGAWVRGEIVQDGDLRKMKPIALVGDWKSYDLPFYNRRGEVETRGGWVTEVYTGVFKPSRPHASNMYENPQASCSKAGVDPRRLEPVDLTPVPLLPELQAQVPYEKMRVDLITMLQGGHGDPKLTLQATQKILGAFMEQNP